MKGAFDRGLTWPFRGDVTIQIVNKCGGNICQKIIGYTDETLDECACRVNDGERGESWGYPQFVKYVQEDSLLIRISNVKLQK